MSQQRQKVRIGKVVSDQTDKTVVVAVEWRQRHPLYRKSVRRITRFHVHDEQNVCRLGDQVRIVETRPLSRTKRWRVLEIIARGEVPEVNPQEIGAPGQEVVQATASSEGSEPLAQSPPVVEAGGQSQSQDQPRETEQ